MAQTFRLAAQYIALSFALQPGRDVYARSLKVVRPLLPGGHLRGGFLTAVHPDTDRTCAERCTMHFSLVLRMYLSYLALCRECAVMNSF